MTSALRARIARGQDPADIAELTCQLLSQRLHPWTSYTEYFRLWEEHGFHVTPVHFYQPIPDTGALNDDLWTAKTTVGIDWNESAQIDLLQTAFPAFSEEYNQFPLAPTAAPTQFYLNQHMFDGTDALVLYCMIRHFKPRRVIEVGSGFSSLVTAEAARRNGATQLTCVEPYPNELLKTGFPGLSRLIEKPVQTVPVAEFQQLEANDVLFIDSSHVVKIGSDVNYLFLEVLPRLQPGVIIHVHDIFLPNEYPRGWVLEQFRFWTEQYLLQAFLSFNSDFEIVFANSYMGGRHADLMKATFPSSPWWGGGSFWMRRRADQVANQTERPT